MYPNIEHHEMVAKLMKQPAAIYATLTHAGVNLQHAAIGIGDEYFEYRIAKSKENRLEELGDLLFYTEALLLHTGLSRDTIVEMKIALDGINLSLCLLFQTVKRCVFYEQALATANLVRVYLSLVQWIKDQAGIDGFSLQDVRDANMKKLAKRYAEFEYSDARAKERIDKVGTPEEEPLFTGNLNESKSVGFVAGIDPSNVRDEFPNTTQAGI